jgi:hypothetical protein
MITQVFYDTAMEDVDFGLPTVFLAGPTVRGHQPHLVSWRREAASLFNDFSSIQLIVPEFKNKAESDQCRYDIPVWEFEGLQRSHVIMFWIPRTKELIGLTTNHEHGYWMARERNKMVYGRPRDAYRMNYLDIMWVEDAKRKGNRSHIPIYTTLEKTVRASLELLKKRYK